VNSIEAPKIWIRKCPDCKSDIICKDKWYRDDAERKGRLCKRCRIRGERNPNFGIEVSEDRKEKQRESLRKHPPAFWYWYGKHLGEDHKRKISQSNSGKRRSWWHIDRIRNANRGNSHRRGIPHDAVPHDAESKRKMRIAKALYIMRHAGKKICPAFNEVACEYFNWLNKWNGWLGRYATNGGEYFVGKLGYWVDYYEPNENVVIEWDEYKRHYKDGRLREKDIIRMTQIKEMLKCRFYRINARTGEIKEY
jgi:hypothetical protein